MTIWRGFVIKMLWGWFVVTTFVGAPELSIPAAIGLAMMVRFMEPNRKSDKGFWEDIAWNTLGAGLTLGVGFIVHSFM